MRPIRLVTLAPGHFHAALVHKRAAAGVDPRAHVYAPLDADLVAHLDRVAAFNARPDDPTRWELDVRAGGDFLDRFLRERPGNAVVLSGRNKPKIDLMLAAVGAGLSVLADKPWVVDAADLPKVDAVLREAGRRDVAVWDMMTERHEVGNRIQRELVLDDELFGGWRPSTPDAPPLTLESVHRLKKLVAGRPLRRPWWWYDPAISGDSLADVGTHLVDLAIRVLAPDEPLDVGRDVSIADAARWPTPLTPAQVCESVGAAALPAALEPRLVDGTFHYAGNGSVTFAVRGVWAKATTLWEYEGAGGDRHDAVAHGRRASVAVRAVGDRSEVTVTATDPADHAGVVRRLRAVCDGWQDRFPGTTIEDTGFVARVYIPDELRVGHEAHFACVLDEFVRYFHHPLAVPAWEASHLRAKYHVTTMGVELAKRERGGGL